jgi:uncharacterized protein HemX
VNSLPPTVPPKPPAQPTRRLALPPAGRAPDPAQPQSPPASTKVEKSTSSPSSGKDNAVALLLGTWLLDQLRRGGAGILVALGLGGGSAYLNSSQATTLQKQLEIRNGEIQALQQFKASALVREQQRAKSYECQLRVLSSALDRQGFRVPRSMPADGAWVIVKSEPGREVLQSIENCEPPPRMPD